MKITDCICLASEEINLMDRKAFGRNLALKIDIIKAFDTLDWNFLLRVLKAFGFVEKFRSWISVVLKSAKLSLSLFMVKQLVSFLVKGELGKVILCQLSSFV